MADAQDNINSIKIIDNKTIAAGGSFTSGSFNAASQKLIGNITLQIQVTGTGTAKFEFSQSNNSVDGFDGDFVLPVSGSSIVTGFTETSGSASDGRDLLNVPMFNSKFFRIIATETVGANPIVVNGFLSTQ